MDFRMYWRYAYAAVALMTAAYPVLAQTRDTGSVFGTVADSQGAAITGAVVTLTNVATVQVRKDAADASGGYLFSLVPVGSYTLAAEHPGFRRHRGRESSGRCEPQ